MQKLEPLCSYGSGSEKSLLAGGWHSIQLTTQNQFQKRGATWIFRVWQLLTCAFELGICVGWKDAAKAIHCESPWESLALECQTTCGPQRLSGPQWFKNPSFITCKDGGIITWARLNKGDPITLLLSPTYMYTKVLWCWDCTQSHLSVRAHQALCMPRCFKNTTLLLLLQVWAAIWCSYGFSTSKPYIYILYIYGLQDAADS